MDQENEDMSVSYQTVRMFIEYKLIRELYDLIRSIKI